MRLRAVRHNRWGKLRTQCAVPVYGGAMPTGPDRPRRVLSQDFGSETPFPVGREAMPSRWITLEDTQTDGIPTGLPWDLAHPHAEPHTEEPVHEDVHEEPAHSHDLPPDNRRLHFGLAGLAAGLILGWMGASLL